MKSAKEWAEAWWQLYWGHEPLSGDEAYIEILTRLIVGIQRDALTLDVPGGDLLSEERLKEIDNRLKRMSNLRETHQSIDLVCTQNVAAKDNLPELLIAYRRALALIRDLSSDNATERYRAGYLAGALSAWKPDKTTGTDHDGGLGRRRVHGLDHSETLRCIACKEIKHTTLEEVWSIAFPEGRLRRLCQECASSYAGV